MLYVKKTNGPHMYMGSTDRSTGTNKRNKNWTGPWLGGSVAGASTCTPKGGRFDSQSGYVWEATN